MELRKYLQDETVTHLGYRAPVCVGLDATVAQAIATMQTQRVGCVLIVDGARLCGIFTERDVLKRVLYEKRALSTPVSNVMTPEPLVVREHEPVYLVLRRMHTGGHRHLPVVNDSAQAVGTISVKRVARFISDHFAAAVYNLPPEPHQYGTSREGA